MTDITLADNTAARRFELSKGGGVQAYAEYEPQDGALKFTHTVVLPGNEGQGLGGKLATFALDDVRRRGLKAIPGCSFIAGYIGKHPEYSDLVENA